MTNPGSTAFSAKVDAVLAEHEQSLGTLRQQSAVRAARGTAAAAKATERFSRLAQRVQEGARERARPTPAEPVLAGDDSVAELEILAGGLDEQTPDPTEPSKAEIDDILDTMRPLPLEPAQPEEDQADTSVLQWTAPPNETDDEPEDLDDDFQDPW